MQSRTAKNASRWTGLYQPCVELRLPERSKRIRSTDRSKNVDGYPRQPMYTGPQVRNRHRTDF